jgi:hypothetical protein
MRGRTAKGVHITVLIVILTVSLLGPVAGTEAAGGVGHTLDEGLLMMVSSELWVTRGGEPVEATTSRSG